MLYRAARLLPNEIILMQKITGFPAGTESPGRGIFGVWGKADYDEGVDQMTDIRPSEFRLKRTSGTEKNIGDVDT